MTRTAGKLRYMPTPRLLDDSKNIVGESPLWHPEEGSLYWTDERTDFASPEPNWPHNRLNDGATDPNGVFWIGSMRNNVGPTGQDIEVSGNSGSLYRVTPDGSVSVWDTGFGITNTLAWSPERKTFYCGCSPSNVIYAYDYRAADSSISNRRPFIAGVTPGLPDGSAMD